MKAKTIMILLTMLFAGYTGKTQLPAGRVDSLEQAIKKEKNDSIKVKLMLALGDAYQEDSNDLLNARKYYIQAGSLAENIHFTAGTFLYLFDYTDILVEQGSYDSALLVSQKAKQLAIETKDSLQLVRALFNIATSYVGMENEKEAVRNFLLARDYYQRNKLLDRVGMCDNELSILYRQTQQFSNAIQYGKEAIDLYRKYRPRVKLAIPLQNLSVVYQSMQQPEKGKPLLMEALAIDRQYKNEYGELNVLINLTDLLFHLNRTENIKGYIDRIIQLSYKIQDKVSECLGMLNLAIYNLRKNKIPIARIQADSALIIARSTGIKSLEQNCFVTLSHIEYAAHQYEKALRYDEQIDLTQEALNTANVNRSIIELQTKYETEKKQAEIELLQTKEKMQMLSIQKKQTLLILTLCILASLIIAGFLYIRNQQRKRNLLLTEQKLQQQRIENLEKEKQLAATEAMLQGQEEERRRLARDLHDGLGGILSGTKYALNDIKENVVISGENAIAFDKTLGMLDISISELRRVAHNMMPERLVNQSLSDALHDLCNQISNSTALNIDYRDFGMELAKIDQPVKVTAYRIVQELLNNIIKHADASSAIVQMIAKENNLNITVEDDGKGFDSSQLTNAEGIGFRNLRNRIDYIKGKLDIHSELGKGTSVYVEIPI